MACRFDDGTRLDIALPLPASGRYSVQEHLRALYEVLRRFGFTRLRYYRRVRVPGSKGLLQLAFEFPENGRKETNDISREVDGQIAELFESFSRVSMPADLVYRIVPHSEAKFLERDPGVRFWNKRFWSREKPSWVEVPVFCREPTGLGGVFAAGVMVFDRSGAKKGV
jgi:hypothetical protein